MTRIIPSPTAAALAVLATIVLLVSGCSLTDDSSLDAWDPFRQNPSLIQVRTDSTGQTTSPSRRYEEELVLETAGKFAGKVTRFYRLRHIEGQVLEAALKQWVEDGRIINYPQLNMLIITADTEVMTHLDKVIERLDSVPPQVFIEARIVEIRKASGFEFGFELRVDRTTASNSPLRRFNGVFPAQSFLDSLLNNRTPNPSPFAFVGSTFEFAAVGNNVRELGDFDYIIQALQSQGYAKILSAPTIAVYAGERAELKAVTQIPIEVTNINNNNTTITVRFEEVGVTLVVQPKVIGTDGILLHIEPGVSSVTSFQESTSSGIAVPVISTRNAKTSVEVADGEILNIGGLFEHRVLEQNRGFPILSSIPLIGEFFQSRKNENSETQIYFILKATILGNPSRTGRRLFDPRTLPTPPGSGE